MNPWGPHTHPARDMDYLSPAGYYHPGDEVVENPLRYCKICLWPTDEYISAHQHLRDTHGIIAEAERPKKAVNVEAEPDEQTCGSRRYDDYDLPIISPPPPYSPPRSSHPSAPSPDELLGPPAAPAPGRLSCETSADLEHGPGRLSCETSADLEHGPGLLERRPPSLELSPPAEDADLVHERPPAYSVFRWRSAWRRIMASSRRLRHVFSKPK